MVRIWDFQGKSGWLGSLPAGRVLLGTPNVCRRVGRPNITLKKVLENDTGMEANKLRTAMLDRMSWRKNFVMATATDAV